MEEGEEKMKFLSFHASKIKSLANTQKYFTNGGVPFLKKAKLVVKGSKYE